MGRYRDIFSPVPHVETPYLVLALPRAECFELLFRKAPGSGRAIQYGHMSGVARKVTHNGQGACLIRSDEDT